MPITASTVLQNKNNADATSYTTGSFTPTANKLYLLTVLSAATASGNTVVPTITTSTGLNFVQEDTAQWTGSTRRVTVFRAMEASGLGAGTITIDFGGANTQICCYWIVDELDGVDTSGTDGSGAVVQSVIRNLGAAATSGSITGMAALGSASNAVHSAWGHGANEATTPKSGWTELGEQFTNAPNQCLETQWLINDNAPTASWATSAAYGAVACEIKAGAAAAFNIEQFGHRFFEDGTETGSTGKAADDQNANISDTVDENIAIRIGVQEVGGGTDGATTDDYQLQRSLNGGTWTDVTSSSSVVKGYTSANLTDAAATTQRMSAGSGTWIAGEISETDGLLTDFQLPKSRFTELLFAITTVAADITTGDAIDFRVLRNGAVLDAYNIVPRLNAPAPAQTLENHFDGTDGTVLTAGSGGNTVAGGNYFDVVNGTGTAPDTIEFDTSRFHSSPSSVLMNSTNTGNEYLEWTSQLTDLTTTLYVRAYIYVVTGIASSADKFIRIYDSTPTEVAFMGFDATPRLRVGDSAGTFTEAGVGTFATGAWYRVEMAIPVGNSVTITGRIFAGANLDGVTADTEWTQAASDTVLTPGNIAAVRFGNSIAVPVVQMDDVAVSTAGWIGPYVVAAGQTVFMGLPIF